MNKKTKYYRRSDIKKRLGKLDLLNVLYGFGDSEFRLESLWKKHEDNILPLWKELFPATRPKLWWLLNYPDTYARLKAEAVIDGWFHAPVSPEAQRKALSDIGELDSSEKKRKQQEFNFGTFLEAYI